jgi:DNA-binding CsgD family transcriptional regulator/tetratricopeptide (TPR) repeat protein
MQLFGRERETALLNRAVSGLLAHQSSIVVVSGEAGIGKSVLLAQALDTARRHAIDVWTGRAEELEHRRPFGMLLGLLGCSTSSPDPNRARLAQLVSAEGGARVPVTVSSDPGLQFRVVDGMVELVEAAALAGPLLLGIDDLQWADPSSLLVLAALVRRVSTLPVALVACVRPLPCPADLSRLLALFDDAGALRVDLAGLDEDGAAALVAAHLDAGPGPSVRSAVARAAGNPLFITELLDALRADQAIEIVDGAAELRGSGLSPTLRLTILRRLGFLSEPAVMALRAASVLGSGFTLVDLSTTMDRPAIDLLPALEELSAAGVVEDDGDRLRFRHDLIREAVYDDLSPSVRRALHREAGQRLAAAGAPLQQVAEQLSRGATPGDVEAIRWLTAAGRDAAARSPEVAVALLQRALDLTSSVDAGHELRLELANCQLLSGRIVDAIDTCRALLVAGADESTRAAARACLGHGLLAVGRIDDAIEQFQRAGSSGHLAAADVASVEAWSGFASLLMGDLDRAAALADRARDLAIDASSPITTSIALTVRAYVWQRRGRPQAALALADEAVVRADRSAGRSGHRYPVHLGRGHVLLDLDDVDEALRAQDRGWRACEELGLRWPLASHQVLAGLGLFLRGDWDDAAAALDAGLDLAVETGERFGVIVSTAVSALIALHRNDLVGAHRSAARACADLDETVGRPFRGHWATWAAALLLEAEGDPGEAYGSLARCWDDCERTGQMNEYPVIGPDLVRLAVEVGTPDRIERVCADLTELATESGVPFVEGAALRCRGLAADEPELLGAAVEALSRGPRVLETALALEEAGRSWLHHGERGRARAALEAAIERFEHLDAVHDVLRVDAALRTVGVRRGRRMVRATARYGWESLTPTEHAVAGLAADGLSNPQIGDRLYVSHRTVQTHLAHIFTKLGITSRVQLAAELTRRQAAAT